MQRGAWAFNLGSVRGSTMTNVAEAISAFEKVRTETDTTGLYGRCLKLIVHGESRIRSFRLELSVLTTAIRSIAGTRRVRRSLGRLRRSVLSPGGGTDREMTDAERDQFASIARRLHRCHEQNERMYRRGTSFYDEELASVRDRFSWPTRYAIRVSRKLEESFLSEEEDLVETLALIASTEFIQSVTQTLAHHDGQTSG